MTVANLPPNLARLAVRSRGARFDGFAEDAHARYRSVRGEVAKQ